MGLPLTQRDRNFLTEQKENKEAENTGLSDSNDSAVAEVGKLLNVDVPFKKQTDPPHVDIYCYEEELRRLDGTSIPFPLQEDGLFVTDSVSDARVILNDGRIIITESAAEIVNVPVIPVRGWSKSVTEGPDYGIWTRDRHGSSTSKKNGTSSFLIEETNKNIKVDVDGVEREVDFSSLLVLPQTMSGPAVASTIQNLLQQAEEESAISEKAQFFRIPNQSKLLVSVDEGADQEILFRSQGYIESDTTVETKFTIKTEGNDTIDFTEDGTTYSITADQNIYIGTALATEIQTKLDTATGSSHTVTYDKKRFTIVALTATTFELLWSSGDNVRFTIGGVLGFDIESDDTGALEYEGDDKVQFNVLTDYNDIFSISINGVAGADVITMEQGSYTTDELMIGIELQIYEDASFNDGDIFIEYISNKFRITSSLNGTSSTIEMTEGITDFLQVINIDNSTVPVDGLNQFEDISNATAQEIADVINAATTGITASAYLTGEKVIVDGEEEDETKVKIIHDATRRFRISDGLRNPNYVLQFTEFTVLSSAGVLSSSCLFNETLETFTLVSGTVGPSSTAEVITAGSFDMKDTLGYDVQKQITGRYANNLLNVKIDGDAQEIELKDFRQCEQDASLGYNNDDIGFDWSGSLSQPLGYVGRLKVGPLMCSGFDDGKEVAQSIKGGLASVGSGGFENAMVHFFTDDETFVIFSGTFGVNSSVEVLPASDPLRDARSTLGFVSPVEVGNEEFYDDVTELRDHLNTYPNITASTSSSLVSHSLLYTSETGFKIGSSWVNLNIPTTKVYDRGSRGWPRLYPNGHLVIDSTNDKIDFWETANVERSATLEHGDYESEDDVSKVVAEALEAAGGNTYEGEYLNRAKKFRFISSGSFTLLFNSGRNALKSIGYLMGFDTADVSGTIITGNNQVSFRNDDFFNPTFFDQFDGEPQIGPATSSGVQNVASDVDLVDEESALYKEEEYLGLGLLAELKALTAFDQELTLNAWEDMATDQRSKVNQEYNALKAQRSCYGNHISEADAIVTQKTNAINSVYPNKSSLDTALASHGGIINLTNEVDIYTAPADFTLGGSEQLNITVSGSDKRVYNKPTPIVRYTGQSKLINGKFTPPTLFTNIVDFDLEMFGFDLTGLLSEIPGYSYAATDPDGLYDITRTADTVATTLSSNSETYDLDGANTLDVAVDNGSPQTATFDATSGYTESNAASTTGFAIKAGVNDKIDFEETAASELTATLAAGSYTGTTLAAQIKTQLDAAGASTYTVDYGITVTNKFTIVSNGAGGGGIFNILWATGTNTATSSDFTLGFNTTDDTGSLTYNSDNVTNFSVVTNVNDEFTMSIDGTGSGNIVISQGHYTSSTLITEMSTQIAADPAYSSGDFTVTYPASKFRITSTTKGTDSTIVVTEGTDDFLQTVDLDGDAPVVGGGDVGDITAVTATEVANILNADITGVSASDVSGNVQIDTLSTKGSISSIQVSGGTARTIIGFDTTVYYGENQNNKLKVDIDADATKDPIELAVSASPIAGATVASDIQTKLQAVGGGGYAAAECTFNETTPYQTFTNMLRIISGVGGTASAVDVSPNTIKIVTGVNDKIDFEETGSSELTATLAAGFYSGTTLATEIKTKMEAVGASTYTITYSSGTKKITLASNGVGGTGIFSILWGSGTNTATNVSDILAFFNQDKTGSLTYTSDGLVKTRDCTEELKFDSQTTEPGHDITATKVTITNTDFTIVTEWTDHGGGTRDEIDFDLTLPAYEYLKDLIDEINLHPGFYCIGLATLLGNISAFFTLEDGDELIIDPNETGDQTTTFDIGYGTSESGSSAYTRITSGTLIVGLNGATPKTITLGKQMSRDKIAAKIQQEVKELSADIVVASGVNDKIDFKESIVGDLVATLTPGTYSASAIATEIKTQLDIAGASTYAVTYANYKFTIASNGVGGDNIFSLLWSSGSGPSIGPDIGFNISSDDTGLLSYTADNTLELSSFAYMGFTCQYTGGKYVLTSGTGGTNSKVTVTGGTAASILKLGTGNGGTETDGTGDFVNNKTITAAEIITKLGTPTGFAITGTNYLMLKSDVAGVTSRIEVSGSAASKLGFGTNNNDDYPLVDQATVKSASLKNVANVDVTTPIVGIFYRGWETDKGNVEIDYYTCDDAAITARQAIITTRLTYFATRKPQITARIPTVVAALTPALYQTRKDEVQVRLNKKTGSYVKIGDEYNKIDNNNDTISSNDDYLSEIDSLL